MKTICDISEKRLAHLRNLYPEVTGETDYARMLASGGLDAVVIATAVRFHFQMAKAALLDPDGQIGRLYGAKTTPEMYIIDPQGKLIYEGAIDNRPTPDASDIKGAENYVSEALTSAMAGKPISQAYTHSYGCSVKYRD